MVDPEKFSFLTEGEAKAFLGKKDGTIDKVGVVWVVTVYPVKMPDAKISTGR